MGVFRCNDELDVVVLGYAGSYHLHYFVTIFFKFKFSKTESFQQLFYPEKTGIYHIWYFSKDDISQFSLVLKIMLCLKISYFSLKNCSYGKTNSRLESSGMKRLISLSKYVFGIFERLFDSQNVSYFVYS